MKTTAHQATAPRPTVDLRLVPAALTAWGSALLLTGDWVVTAGAQSSGGLRPWLLLGSVLVSAALVGAVFALALDWWGTRRAPATTRRRPQTWGRAGATAAVTGAILCATIAGAVGATAMHQQATAVNSLQSMGETADGGVHRMQLEVVQRPVAWQAAGEHPGFQASGEEDSGVVIAVRTSDGFPARVFARDSRWRSVGQGEIVTAVVSAEGVSGGEVQLRSNGAPHITGRSQPNGLMSWLATAKQRFMASAVQLGPAASSLLPGMTYGDRSGFDPALEQAMKDTGLTHLTAVSGSNCALVLILTAHLVMSFGGGRRLCVVAGLVALMLFAVLVGPDASVVRAAVMGSVGAVAILAGRGGGSLSALAVAVCALLLLDPGWGRDFGFALSVCATAGIVITGRPLIRVLSRWMPALVAAVLAVPVVAQLWCAAVLTLLSPTVPVWSVPANVVVAPVVPVVTVIGLLALMGFGQSSALGQLIGQALTTLGQWPVEFVAATAHFFAGLPAAVQPWWEPPVGPVVMAGLCLVVILSVHGMDARFSRRTLRGTVSPDPPPRPVPEQAWRQARRRRRRWLWGCWSLIGVLGAIVLAATVYPPNDREDWLAIMCDVGQGDAVLLRSGVGERATTVLIDTGPDPAALRTCLRQSKVTRLDLVILTHDHNDHVAGAAGLDQVVEVSELWWSSGTGRPPQEIADWTAPSHTPAVGTVFSRDGFRLEILGPSGPPVAAVDSSGENNASLVIRAHVTGPEGFAGATVLAAGDLEQDGARQLVRAAGEALDVDVLKVSHHGARNGGTAIIDAASPSLALISVGEKNTYGHPSEQITGHLHQTGVVIARTDQLGTVGLYPDAQQQALSIEPRR